MKRGLQALFVAILLGMLWATTRASLDRSVLAAAVDLARLAPGDSFSRLLVGRNR